MIEAIRLLKNVQKILDAETSNIVERKIDLYQDHISNYFKRSKKNLQIPRFDDF
jgi:hypothetical protein